METNVLKGCDSTSIPTYACWSGRSSNSQRDNYYLFADEENITNHKLATSILFTLHERPF
jgi:hypothetical protein